MQSIFKFDKKAKIYSAVGFEEDKIRRRAPKEVEYVTNPHFDTTNSLYNVGFILYKKKIKDAYILYGDLLLEDGFFNNLKTDENSTVFSANRPQGGVQCNSYDGRLNLMMWNINKIMPYWSEVSWVNEKHCLFIKEFLKNIDTHKYFLFEIFNKIAETDHINHKHIDSFSLDIDRINDLKKGNELAGIC